MTDTPTDRPTDRPTVTVSENGNYLSCPCGARCYNNSREARRFRLRHPVLCQARKQFTKQLAAGTRSVDADERWQADNELAGKKARLA
jgi:hypothetical protein